MDITKLSSDKQGMICRKRNAAYNTILASTTSLLDSYLQDNQQQPSSPASSSTSQTTGDTTFEPSIDMMVNDFDDEQTLTEEEALAELEAQDPADEITTLKKESEMPLEELLAHYTKHVEQNYERRHKRKKSSKKNQSQKQSKKQYILAKATETNDPPITSVDEVIVIEESDEEVEVMKTERIDADIGDDGSIEDAQEKYEGVDDDDDADFTEDNGNNIDAESEYTDKAVDFSKRSHLLELYPEKFTNINQKFDDDLSEDDEDDDDYDLDYVKKTIMVGLAFQATIPVGLSKYGDVLPYENEDKLIWEPSQVSEQEVEDYLMRVKEVKSSISPLLEEEIPSSSASVISESDLGLGCNLVKDDEQALHLLVQCGYNFKEALRRKRLNAVPLTGSMSLWSEEECRNFEEGIQKFGKDFRKIRQTQVRTRSIRELVQFYYLWKKTERRDQDVVDSDTVDHMDIYLDFDERDTGSNGGAKQMSSSLAGECLISNQTFSTKKQQHNAVSAPLSNFSIMNETKRLVRLSNHQNKLSGNKKSHNDGNTSQSKQIAHRRRNGLIANKAHHTEQNGTFGSKCKWDASLLAGAKSWRKHSNNLTKASPTNSSSTGIHCGKK